MKPTKMLAFTPAAGDSSLSAEFDCYHPDAAAARQEVPGNMSWQESHGLEFIEAEANLAPVDLPKILEHMIKHCWKDGAVSDGAARGRLQLGGARQADLARREAVAVKSPNEIFALARMKATNAAPAPRVAPTKLPQAPMDKHPHLNGIAADWKTHESLKRVNAYTFRGDTRGPAAIKQAQGFHPPISRTDDYYVNNVVRVEFQSYMQRRYQIDVSNAEFTRAYAGAARGPEERRVLHNYFVWRQVVSNEAYHAGRMLATEALKGYISTTRAATVAKGFARGNGWVYVTLVRGGFLIPDQRTTEWTKAFGEQEIALPAPVAWNEVFGFRHVAPGKGGLFDGPVYLRKGFEARNAKAFEEAHLLLSGKKQ